MRGHFRSEPEMAGRGRYYCIHGILPQTVSTSKGLFWDDFRKQMPSETWDPLGTSIVILDFLNFVLV